ncbi:MAG: hypothetical protein JW759_08025 [Candidatus Coatesbacteria bacterium]|nr:hypothetical protein [Candidatus Coatesbacteria bacterium]
MQAWLNSNFLWTQFLVCGVVVALAGVKLSRFGHIMGEKLKIGSTWIGLVLLAAVTSMPELITSCTAGDIGAPDMAVGNLLGSNLFNVAILGMLGLMMPRLAKWDGKGMRHLLSCCLNLFILSVALLAIVFHKAVPLKAPFEVQNLRGLPIGASSIVIFAIYLLSMFLIFVHEKAENAVEAPANMTDSRMTTSLSYENEVLSRVCVKFAACAAIIVSAGWRMVVLGDILAEIPINILGTQLVLGQSIIGTFFLAVATSLPEFAVCYAAVRMGAADMAIGNVLGSNIFNIATIPLADIFFTKGPILAHVSGIHLVTGLIVILASLTFILGSSYRGLFVGFRQLPMCAAIVALWLGGWLLIFVLNCRLVQP